MGAWGYGLFDSDHDLDIVDDLGVEAGLSKLEEAAVKKDPSKKDSIYYTLHGGGETSEEVRKHLDSGVLEELFAKKEAEMLNPPEHAWVPDYTFVLLGACAMTLGCRIPEKYKLQMQKRFLTIGMMEAAERQMFKALNSPDGYQEGVPYKFDLPEDVEAALEAEMKAREDHAKATNAPWVLMNVPAPHGMFAGPPKNAALRTTMDEAKFGDLLCGGCGADKKPTGEALLRCGKCKKRSYCSVECQKEHWKLHKQVCKATRASGDDKVLGEN